MAFSCLIVDDNEAFLASASSLLEGDSLHIVGLARTGDEAARLVAEMRPDVALVDVDLGSESGFEVAATLAAFDSPPKVLLISTHAEDDLVDLIALSPAVGFLPKSRLSTDRVLEFLG
jgi:DNA-binding NarL/FixJ family response regulator